MANAVAGHALDFDDWELSGNTHPSVVIFPALLAVAAERPFSGRATLEAYLVGFEMIVRLGEAVNFEHYNKGWHSTATLGPIGSTAAVARLRCLDRIQTAQALSIAVSQAVGYNCQFGSNAKPLQGGFAAKTGVIAASLAENGLTGQPHVLDGPTGFIRLMGHGDTERFSAVFERLGDTLALADHGLGVKPYPSCSYTHRVIDCALAIRRNQGFDPARMVRITASLPDFHAAVLPFHQPTNQAEALFSVPFCVVLALMRGQVTPADIEAEVWTESALIDMIARVKLHIRRPKNPSLNYDSDDPDWVEIEMGDGTCYRSEVAFPLGAPQNRMTSEQILRKFLFNAGLVERYTPLKHAAITALRHWDTASDINAVVHSLADLTAPGSISHGLFSQGNRSNW
jgi:2-methylcitrate dehydratase PrpD